MSFLSSDKGCKAHVVFHFPNPFSLYFPQNLPLYKHCHSVDLMSCCLIGSDPGWLNYLGTFWKERTQQASLIDTPTQTHMLLWKGLQIPSTAEVHGHYFHIKLEVLMSDHPVSPTLSAAQIPTLANSERLSFIFPSKWDELWCSQTALLTCLWSVNIQTNIILKGIYNQLQLEKIINIWIF